MLHVVPTYEQMPSPPSSSSSDNENNNIVLNKPKVDIKSNQPMIVKPIPTITEKSYTGFGLGVKQAPQQNSNLKIKELILKIKYVLNLKDSKTIVELIKEVKMNRDKESAIAKFEDLLKCSQINSTDSETAMNDFKTIIGYSKP